MGAQDCAERYVGQIERDPDGALWAVVYYGGECVSREQVHSLRKGKRRVTDLVRAAADNYPNGPLHPATPSRLGSLENKPLPAQRRPMAVAHFA